jgi:hypothetical protein
MKNFSVSQTLATTSGILFSYLFDDIITIIVVITITMSLQRSDASIGVG